jgi:hypothetical protein
MAWGPHTRRVHGPYMSYTLTASLTCIPHRTRLPLAPTALVAVLSSAIGLLSPPLPVAQRAVSTGHIHLVYPHSPDRHPRHHRRSHPHEPSPSHMPAESLPRTSARVHVPCVCRASHKHRLRAIDRSARRTVLTGGVQRRCDERCTAALEVGWLQVGVSSATAFSESYRVHHMTTVLTPALLHCHGRRKPPR